jgi:hypothetical protein
MALVMLLGTYDLGRAFGYGVAMQQATREAARVAANARLIQALQGSTTANGPYYAVRKRLVEAAVPLPLTCPTSPGDTATDTYTYPSGTPSPTTATRYTTTCTGPGGSSWTVQILFAPTVTLASGATVGAPSQGARVEVRANGTLPLLTGFLTGVAGISGIGIQGDTYMVVL